jgi:hypothetical protein
MNEELFDLPGSRNKILMWKAYAYIGKGRKARQVDGWVRASNERIARRVARSWFKDVYGATNAFVVHQSWEEYARALKMAGFQIL